MKCRNGHAVPDGAVYCPECGVALRGSEAATQPPAEAADVPHVATEIPDALRARRRATPRRAVAALLGIVVVVAAAVVAGLILSHRADADQAQSSSPSATEVDPARAAVDKCVSDYTWALSTMTADEYGQGVDTVTYQWGTDDGRLYQAEKYLGAFRLDRSQNGVDHASALLTQKITQDCQAAFGAGGE